MQIDTRIICNNDIHNTLYCVRVFGILTPGFYLYTCIPLHELLQG